VVGQDYSKRVAGPISYGTVSIQYINVYRWVILVGLFYRISKCPKPKGGSHRREASEGG